MSLFSWPDNAKVGRVVPKNKIYQHTWPSAALRERFVAQVRQISWQYKLAPETVNLPARLDVPEIQVFDIELKTPELDDELLRCIDRAIPRPILFQLHYEQRARMAAAYKRPSEAETGKWVIDRYFADNWQPTDAERQPLPIALDLLGLYEQLLRTLLPHPARPGESLPAQLDRLGRLRSREGEYRKLETRLHKEKQFNRKVALNAQLRELKNEIESLTA